LGRDFPVERDNSPFKVSEEYKAWAEENLRVLGVLPTDHIVALHIREGPSNGDPKDIRLPDPQSFGPAINYLVQNDVKVVRYGSSHHTPLPPTDGLIDLPAQYPGRNSLDFAVIHKSLFMISTMSGPAALANWMGVPTLITNSASLGRNTLSGVKANRYLPQRFLDETGKILSLSQTLASPLAYWEGLHSREIPADPPTLKSSSSDILNATVEMLDLVSGATDPFISLHKKADEIRRESDAISYGKFSGTFLSANEDWIS
jgi:putative glycosyltransferase (TIGR04372 family)